MDVLGRVRSLSRARAAGDDHTATTFELFFDLVYVFAVTQVTGYMAHEHSAHGCCRGCCCSRCCGGRGRATPG